MEKNKYMLENSFVMALISAITVIAIGLLLTKIPYYLELIIVTAVGLIYSLNIKRLISHSQSIVFALSYTVLLLIFQVVFMTFKASIDTFFLVQLMLYFIFIIPKMALQIVLRGLFSYGLLLLVNRVCYAVLNPQVFKQENINNWFQLNRKKTIIVASAIILVLVYLIFPKANIFVNAGRNIEGANTPILLCNGDVVTVGYRNIGLYDTKANKFSSIGKLNRPRINSTITLLPNDNILVAGGSSNNISLKTTEIINPKDKTITFGSDMIVPRENHTATLLPNGKVFVAGGTTSDIRILGPSKKNISSELYDPKLNKFVPASNMLAKADRSIYSTLLSNGKVLIIGDMKSQIYNPNTNSFSYTVNSESFSGIKTVATLSDGNIAIVDRNGQDGKNLVVELYNPYMNKFSEITLQEANMQDMYGVTGGGSNHWGYSATVLASGKLLVAGGAVGDGPFIRPLNKSEICDLKTKTCVAGPRPKNKRISGSTILLPNKKVLIIGGDDRRKDVINAELYVEKL